MATNFLTFVIMASLAVVCSVAAITAVYLVASTIKDSIFDNVKQFPKGRKQKNYQELERMKEARELVLNAYREAERNGTEENKVILNNLGMAMYIMNECMD